MFFANCYDFFILEFEPSTRNVRMFLFLEAILQRYVCTACLRSCGTIDVKLISLECFFAINVLKFPFSQLKKKCLSFHFSTKNETKRAELKTSPSL